MEGNTEEAYFASKEGVQCLTLVSSSSEKLLSISGEKVGRLWAGGRRRAGGGDARPIAPAQWVNPINNRDSIASAAYVTEAPPAIETIERRQQRKSLCSERHAISRTGQQGSAPMLSRLFTIVLLAVASLRVNAASLTGVIITNEATSSSAVDVVAIDQVNTTIRSALADTAGDAQNQTEETRREALKTYRELAEKEPETYLPDVAATLNDLGIFDSDQNRIRRLGRNLRKR